MPKIKYLWLITFAYLFAALVFAFSLGFGIKRLPDIGQPKTDYEVWIYKNHDITQTITPQHNGLNILTVYMRNVMLRNRQPVIFSLRDSAGRIVREIDLNGYNVVDGDSVRFQFPQIPDSAGKTYQLVFSSPTSGFTDAIGVGISGKTISFQAYYYPSGRFTVVAGEILSFFKSLFNPGFVILFVILGFLAVGCGLLIFSYV